MAKRKIKPLPWASTPISNIVQHEAKGMRDWVVQRTAFCEWARQKDPRRSLRNAFKMQLGRQNYTWQGEYRNWIWEAHDQSWRAFISTAGFSFEVHPDFGPEQAWLAWADFLSRWNLGRTGMVSYYHELMACLKEDRT